MLAASIILCVAFETSMLPGVARVKKVRKSQDTHTEDEITKTPNASVKIYLRNLMGISFLLVSILVSFCATPTAPLDVVWGQTIDNARFVYKWFLSSSPN